MSGGTLGDRLLVERQRRGWSRERLGLELGIAPQAIAALEMRLGAVSATAEERLAAWIDPPAADPPAASPAPRPRKPAPGTRASRWRQHRSLPPAETDDVERLRRELWPWLDGLETAGERLQALRRRAKLTQSQLAVASGVSLRTIYSCEHDEYAQPQRYIQRALLRALGLPFAFRAALWRSTGNTDTRKPSQPLEKP